MAVVKPSEAERDALSKTSAGFRSHVPQMQEDLLVVKQIKRHIHDLLVDERVHAQRLNLLDDKIRELRLSPLSVLSPLRPLSPLGGDKLCSSASPEQQRYTTDNDLSPFSTMSSSPTASPVAGLPAFRVASRLLHARSASSRLLRSASSFLGGSFSGSFFGSLGRKRSFLPRRRLAKSSSPVRGATSSSLPDRRP
ncbi:hypothetical protein T484DRAFT_1747759 [Baffinella frigidus]|nr:hypothetical protein T484DRAFT_1747759 [Cryptophyta sp. CCMP2293]